MNKIKIVSFLIALCMLFMLFSGCKTQEAANSADVQENEPEVDAEPESCIFSSVEELVNAVQDARKTQSSDPIVISNNLADISVLYAPSEVYDQFQLLLIEATAYRIFYYYKPTEDSSDKVNFSENITVTVCRGSEYSLESIGKQHGLTADADGYIYNASKEKIYFMQDDTMISIHVPENMNNYDTLRSLCQMEKIVIDSAA